MSTDTPRDLLVRIGRLRRVMQESQRCDCVCREILEVTWIEVQGLRNDDKNIPGEGVHSLVVRHTSHLELFDVLDCFGPEVRSAVEFLLHEVWMVLGDLLSNIKAFLQVGCRTWLQNLGSDLFIPSVPGILF